MSEARILMIVPTLGERIGYLTETLTSIRNQSEECDLVVVAPEHASQARQLALKFGAQVLDDPGGLAAAINRGAQVLQPHHEFLNWLGDDDLLEPHALARAVQVLDKDRDAVAAYGGCRYINESGRTLWTSHVGRLAPKILNWGPDLIPQPGMLIRSSAWLAVGGLDESFTMAFDLDLLLKLKRRGRLRDAGAVLSAFRWHADSLTAANRRRNIEESERAKRRALPVKARGFSWIWEYPVRWATYAAAWEVQRRALKARKP